MPLTKQSLQYGTVGMLILFLLACGLKEKKWTGTITEKDGITVVNNPGKPLYDHDVMQFEEELEIGGLGEDGEPLFFGIGVLAVDDEGNIYALDQRALRIKVFNGSGKELRTFGREGQGPGEFQSLHNIILTKKNTLMVLDRQSLRLSYFSLAGELLSEHSLSEIPRIFRIYLDGEGGYWARLNLRGDKYVYQIKKLDSQLQDILLAAEFDHPRRRDIFEMFGPNLVFSQMPDNRIVWANSDKYELHVLDIKGQEVRQIIKAYDPVAITSAEKEQMTKEFFRGLPSSREAVYPQNYPPMRNAFSDESGRLYVATYEKPENGTGTVYDIFDPEGRFIAKQKLNFAPRCWKNGKLYTIEEDEEGNQIVKRYAVTWTY